MILVRPSALLALALLAFLGASVDAQAQRNQNVPLSHGRYCGVGNSQAGEAPVDALDIACMEHDRCAGSSALPTCDCHRVFERAAAAVANDAEEPATIRRLAQNMIAAISRVPCDAGGQVVNPVTQPRAVPPPPATVVPSTDSTTPQPGVPRSAPTRP